MLASIAVIISIGIIGCTVSGGGSQNLEDYPGMVQELAQQFDLDPGRVLEVLEQTRGTAAEGMKKRLGEQWARTKETMGTRFEEMLKKAVEEEEITARQMEEILAKKTETAQSIEALKDLPPEERRGSAEELRDNIIEWAQENGLDLRFLMGPEHKGHGMSLFQRHGENHEELFHEGVSGQHFEGCNFEL